MIFGVPFFAIFGAVPPAPVAVLRGSAFTTMDLYCIGSLCILVRSYFGSTYVWIFSTPTGVGEHIQPREQRNTAPVKAFVPDPDPVTEAANVKPHPP